MITYETYKLVHLLSILVLFTFAGFISTNHFQRIHKIFFGLCSVFIFVAGMGLIARLNFKHSEAFPLWIKLKIIIWLLINLLLILFFKIKKLRIIWGGFLFVAIASAIWIAINKPL